MEYVFYIRDDGGILTRHGAAREQTSRKDLEHRGYIHVEHLLGWAEDKVYWNAKTGYASGWAPLRPNGPRSLATGADT